MRPRALDVPRLFASLLLLAVVSPPAQASISTIRTFVNGTKDDLTTTTIKDLHIHYNQALTSAAVLSGQGVTIAITGGGSDVDINFTQAVPLGEAVTVQAMTDNNKLDIKEWWWTDANHQPVTRTFKYTDAKGKEHTTTITKYDELRRGDEADLSAPKIDLHTIVNKSHHWGGVGRHNNPVSILMDVRKLIAGRPNGMDPVKLEDNIKKAIKQWTDCTKFPNNGSVPKAGQNGVPKNDGQQLERDPAVMAPGPTHAGATGKKFRSVTVRECQAAFMKYPKGLTIDVITDPADTRKGDITADWGIPAGYKGAIGVGEPHAGKGPPASEKEKTTSGSIFIDKSKPWHLGTDSNGDGYIANDDNDAVPANEFDFYSVFKHEVGHIICFNHAGVNFTAGDVRFDAPVRCPCAGNVRDDSPDPVQVGDHTVAEPEATYFSSDRPGGQGGLDLWRAVYDGGNWTTTNLGPRINTSADERDPFVSGDGSMLLFASNRSGGLGGFDLYQAFVDTSSAAFDSVATLGSQVNSSADDLHPTLTADMRTLVFGSSRSGGFGGSDIWLSEWIEGAAFSPAFNAGSGLNTAANERDPSISADAAAMYFASDRAGGAGGFDLWWALRDTTGWLPPAPLTGLNSPSQDLAPSIRSDERSLSFASDRPGGLGGFDIYDAPVVHTPPVPVTIEGTPTAGAVGVTVQGPGGACVVSVSTAGRANAEAVVAALAAALNGSACYLARSGHAAAYGTFLLIAGNVQPGDVTTSNTDPGLLVNGDPPPNVLPLVSNPWAFGVLCVAAMAGLGMAALRRRRRDGLRPGGG